MVFGYMWQRVNWCLTRARGMDPLDPPPYQTRDDPILDALLTSHASIESRGLRKVSHARLIFGHPLGLYDERSWLSAMSSQSIGNSVL